MSNVVRFAKPKQFPASGADRHRPRGEAEADISRLMGTAIDAQKIARRGIMTALFDLELAVSRCHQAIALIPESEGAERRRLDDELRAVEQALADARSVARSL